MIIKVPKLRPTVSVNYENLVAALAAVYFLENIYYVTLHPRVENVLWVLQFVLLGCVGLVLCLQKMTAQNMKIRLLVLGVFLLSFLFSGVLPLLKYGLVILAGMRSGTSELIKKILRVYIFCVILTVILAIVGILPSRIVRRGFTTYGFVHANTLAQYIFAALCCFVVLRKSRFRGKQWGIIIMVFLGTWCLTDSRTTVMSMVFLVLLVALTGIFPKVFQRGRILYYLAIWLPVLLLLLSFLLIISYDVSQPLMVNLDEMFNGRVALAYNMWETLPMTAFGQEISGTVVENAYITGVYQFGVIPIVVEMIILMYAIRKSMVIKSYGILACLLAFSMHGLAESSTFNPFINVALLTTFSDHQMILRNKQSGGTDGVNDFNIHSRI